MPKQEEINEEEDGFIFIPPCIIIPKRGSAPLFTSGSSEGDMWAMKMTAYTVGGALALAIIFLVLLLWLG